MTFNGEKYIKEILEAVEAQDCDFEFEVLVIDSGSTDRTLKILQDFPRTRVRHIPNSEFGHGRTRNLAAKIARGQLIAFLTHDAIPANSHWLANLVAPFSLSPLIVGVLGRQEPRPGCVPMIKYEILMTFARQGANFGATISSRHSFDGHSSFDQQAVGFYSDVNSATRVDFLKDIIPYRDVPYAEDQMFAEDFLAAGYLKAYSPDASVIHSNDLTTKEIAPRIFDETIGLRNMGIVIAPLSFSHTIRMVVRKTLGDASRIVKDHQMSSREKFFWLWVNPVFILRKWRSYNHAARIDLAVASSDPTQSLEGQRRY
ncbi:glycosyltransferase family A protein [Alpinimonas psychrophila]